MEQNTGKRRALRQRIYTISGYEAEQNSETEEHEYLEKLSKFLVGQEFMRLGHCIQAGKWNLVLNNAKKLKAASNELGVLCFDRYLDGMRGAARGQNTGEALQLMSLITEKRVQLRNLLTEERELCDM